MWVFCLFFFSFRSKHCHSELTANDICSFRIFPWKFIGKNDSIFFSQWEGTARRAISTSVIESSSSGSTSGFHDIAFTALEVISSTHWETMLVSKYSHGEIWMIRVLFEELEFSCFCCWRRHDDDDGYGDKSCLYEGDKLEEKMTDRRGRFWNFLAKKSKRWHSKVVNSTWKL